MQYTATNYANDIKIYAINKKITEKYVQIITDLFRIFFIMTGIVGNM